MKKEALIHPVPGVTMIVDLSLMDGFRAVGEDYTKLHEGANRDIMRKLGERFLVALAACEDPMIIEIADEADMYVTGSIVGPDANVLFNRVRPFIQDALSLASDEFMLQAKADRAAVWIDAAPDGWCRYKVTWDSKRHPGRLPRSIAVA